MPHYRFNALDGDITYQISLYAKSFRADSSGRVGFFDHSGNLIRMFNADEIVVSSIEKVDMEENRG